MTFSSSSVQWTPPDWHSFELVALEEVVSCKPSDNHYHDFCLHSSIFSVFSFDQHATHLHILGEHMFVTPNYISASTTHFVVSNYSLPLFLAMVFPLLLIPVCTNSISVVSQRTSHHAASERRLAVCAMPVQARSSRLEFRRTGSGMPTAIA